MCGSRGVLAVFFWLFLRCSARAIMELMMIFEILEWGGRGMRFVKSEEKICGLWLFRHT